MLVHTCRKTKNEPNATKKEATLSELRRSKELLAGQARLHRSKRQKADVQVHTVGSNPVFVQGRHRVGLNTYYWAC